MSVTVLAASWQDPDGVKTALLDVCRFTPIQYVFADQGFAGRLVEWAARTLRMVIDILQTRRATWLPGPPQAVGGGKDPGMADRSRPAGA